MASVRCRWKGCNEAQSAYDILLHEQTCTWRREVCGTCGMTVAPYLHDEEACSHALAAKSHPSMNGQGRFKCKVCGFSADDINLVRQHTTLVHPKQAGMVPASNPKGNTMAPSKTFYGPNLADNQQEWGDYLSEMQDAIEKGYCDNILKDLARAIFDRRDHLQGEAPGFSFRNGEVRTVPPLSTPAPAARPGAGSAEYDPQGVFVGLIKPVPSQSAWEAIPNTHQVEIAGKRYDKRDIVGKTIRMPMTVNPSYVRALKIKVIGVGDKRAKVEWVDLPKEGSKYRDLADQGKPVFVPLDSLKDILG